MSAETEYLHDALLAIQMSTTNLGILQEEVADTSFFQDYRDAFNADFKHILQIQARIEKFLKLKAA